MSTGHLDEELEEMMGMIAIKQSSIEIALSCSSDRVLIRSVLDRYTHLQRNY
jgi:hypothetical protein